MSKLFEKVNDIFDSALATNESFVQCSRCGEYEYLAENETICSACKLAENEAVEEEITEADISIDSTLEPVNPVSRTKELFEGYVHDLFAEKKNETEAVSNVNIAYNETGATVTIFFDEEYVTTQFENPSWDESVHDTYINYFIDRFNQAGSIQNKLWTAQLEMAGDFYEDIKITWINDDTEIVEESETALTAAESKIEDAIKTSSNEYELENIQLWITPQGNINIRTLDDKDIVTLGIEGFSETEIEELRDKGYFSQYDESNLTEDEEKSFPLLDKYGLNKDDQFKYMMLSRMQSDCKYYLGHGNRNEKDLWAKDPAVHIAIMKELYDSVPEEPQWLTREELESYEKEMVAPVTEEEVIVEADNNFSVKIIVNGELNYSGNMSIDDINEILSVANSIEPSTHEELVDSEVIDLNEGFFNLYRSYDKLYGISKYSPSELRSFLDDVKAHSRISDKDYEILTDFANKYEELINQTGYESDLVEAEVPASQLDFKHQQLAKIQADIESIAELKAEDTSNDLYTALLDCYDEMVEVLTKAIAEDPVGTVVGSDEEIGLTITDEEPVNEEPIEEPVEEPTEEQPEIL